jgi:hypothetical protein
LVRELDAAGCLGQGASESPALMAEEFILEESTRHRGAIHLYEGTGPSQASLVNGRGNEFLTGARFALDQDGRIGWSYHLYRVQDAAETWAGANQFFLERH